MGLTTCRECGKKVSTEVQTCLHCGVSSPQGLSHRVDNNNFHLVGYVLYLLIAALLLGHLFYNVAESGDSSASSSISKQEKGTAAQSVPEDNEVRIFSSKPEEVDAVLRGRDMSYAWWLDSDTWTVTPGVYKWHPNAEYGLHSDAKGIASLVIPDSTYIPLKHLARNPLRYFRNGAPDAEIVAKTWRLVNGTKMLDLTIEGKSRDEAPMTWRSYNYSSKEFGTIHLVAFTEQNIYHYKKADIEKLLNGLEITKG